MSKKIRYYQHEADIAVNEALQLGIRRLLLLMPGGTGKTFTAVHITRNMGRKLWITHEESLLTQSAVALLAELDLMPFEQLQETVEYFDGSVIELKKFYRSPWVPSDVSDRARLINDNLGIIKAEMFDIDKPIVMASAQTLYNRLEQIPLDWFKVVIADECDLFGSKSFREPLDKLKFDLLLGLTATPYRMDNVLMSDIFDKVVYEYKIEDAIKDGYLCEINAIVVRTSTNLDTLSTVNGDFNQGELANKVNTLERNNKIVNKYIEYCSGQQFICFGADVQHVIDLYEAFEAKGIKTSYVVSDKDKMIVGTDRKTIVTQFKKGEIIGLINFNIFGAGFDHADIGCVIMGCPTKSKRKFLQQLFRVTRLKSATFVKRFGQVGTILDIVDGTSKHDIVNTHELDKGKDPADRIFLSSENKQKLIEARGRKLEGEVKEDRKVKLLKLPELRYSKSFGSTIETTDEQKRILTKLGYDTLSVFYSQAAFNDIMLNRKATPAQIAELKKLNYDCEGFIKLGVATTVLNKRNIYV